MGSKYGPSITALIQDTLVNHIEFVHRIGVNVNYDQLLGQISTLDNDILLNSFYIGTAPNPTESSNIIIAGNEIPYLVSSNITVNEA